jgi:hypothetical protein
VDRRELKKRRTFRVANTNNRSCRSGEGTPITKVAKNELGSEGLDATLDTLARELDTLAREGARRMIAVALEAEVEAYLERFRAVRGEDGRAAVRNGRGKPRQVTLGSGTVTIDAPRVDDKREVDGERQKFTSAILPPYLPKSMQPKAKSSLHEIMNRPTRANALKAIKSFVADFGAKYPKAVECLTKDQDALLAFFDFPAEHWKHLRTTNPIESAFATVRLRARASPRAPARAPPGSPWSSSCCSPPSSRGASSTAPSSCRLCAQGSSSATAFASSAMSMRALRGPQRPRVRRGQSRFRTRRSPLDQISDPQHLIISRGAAASIYFAGCLFS